jgi:hypothetical protein
MLLVKIHLKTALELTRGPEIEDMEFETHKQIVDTFDGKFELKVNEKNITKHNVPVGTIMEGAHSEE